MFDILLTASVAFIITFMAIPVIIKVAEEKDLYDIPDERKLHTKLVASLGGIGIVAGFLLSSLLSIQGYLNPEFQYFYAAILVVFFIGLKDDIVILSATKKMLGQIIAASILIHLGGIRLDSMYGFLGFEQLPEGFSLALSYLTIIVIINSFNLIDGIDGLASSLGILSMVIFGCYFYAIDYQSYALFAFAMSGALMAFIIFNHHPAKIFMGDSGSLVLGIINAILVIKFINVASSPFAAVHIQGAVAIGIAILFVPLLDTLRVFSIRIVNGRSPFSPDRNHVHHLLLDNGMNQITVTLVCVAANILFVVMAWFGRFLGSNYLMLVLLCVAFTAVGILFYNNKRRKMAIARRLYEDARSDAASRVVTFVKKSEQVQEETKIAELTK
ncbi:MAG: MraY family glycosyltransferase [Chitinophagaceae bacterium]|nr:undecaprenyl/decaprenyl-phosphate alpha-N-acetylglucosaminyl 1-phosphate transferase [Chitinophagaceae bacterium]MCB0741271.1 undecaprenyl/decaprenyl-phosphate alpha-N-acetylglucosaminyl 1-phosphate transferase [Chitinophagaceae bacterium]HQV07056.1 MraY family glycosyltransferase [Chitinophagaceae bacterium]